MKKIIIIFIGISLLASCKHKSLIEEIPEVIPCDANQIDFVNQVLPILQSSCATTGCHNAASHQDGVVLDTYENIIQTADVNAGNANDSELYEVLVENGNDIMPPQGSGMSLSAAQIIKDWINQGAKNVTCNNNTSCDSVNVSYAQTVKPLLDNQCVSCHSSVSTNGVFLYDYTQVLINVNNGKLAGSINHSNGFSAMPQGGAKFDICKLTIINNWIAEGAQNN